MEIENGGVHLQVDVTGISIASHITTRDKLGFLSSIRPDPVLKAAFMVGTGLPADKLDFDAVNDISYKKTDIDQKHTTQKSKCIVIATVGGRVTRAAFTLDSNVRYVSLVGNTDNIGTALKGGVSLNSIALNAARKAYLEKLGATYNNNTIHLYMNKNSEMHVSEDGAWTTGQKTVSAAGIQGGTNDPTKFGGDFAAAGPLMNAKAVIISDDPFFRATRGDLIKAVNSWLNGDAARRVVYPSQFYRIPNKSSDGTVQMPKSGQSVLYGPDLIAAYHLLGTLARCCFDDENASPDFVTAMPFLVEL